MINNKTPVRHWICWYSCWGFQISVSLLGLLAKIKV